MLRDLNEICLISSSPGRRGWAPEQSCQGFYQARPLWQPGSPYQWPGFLSVLLSTPHYVPSSFPPQMFTVGLPPSGVLSSYLPLWEVHVNPAGADRMDVSRAPSTTWEVVGGPSGASISQWCQVSLYPEEWSGWSLSCHTAGRRNLKRQSWYAGIGCARSVWPTTEGFLVRESKVYFRVSLRLRRGEGNKPGLAGRKRWGRGKGVWTGW